MLQNQDGIAKEWSKTFQLLKWIGSKFGESYFLKRAPTPPEPVDVPPDARERVAPKMLEVDGLTVRYGGVTAVDQRGAHARSRARSPA